MEELVNAIESEDLPPGQLNDVYNTLAKVLGNIVKSPQEPKFRSLKKDNKLVQEKLGQSAAAISLLLALGFEDAGASFTCPLYVSAEPMEEVVQLLQCVLASREEEAPAAAAPAAAPAAARSVAAGAQSFAKRSDVEQQRAGQANQLQAVREAQQAQYADGGASPSPALASAAGTGTLAPASAADTGSNADAKKKPQRSAFDFDSRAKKEQQAQKAANGLQDLRAIQKEKFQDFKENPTAAKTEAYQKPASVSNGLNKPDDSWGGWLGGWLGGGGGGSSGSGGGGGGRQERRGPNIKGMGDLPKPVQRG